MLARDKNVLTGIGSMPRGATTNSLRCPRDGSRNDSAAPLLFSYKEPLINLRLRARAPSLNALARACITANDGLLEQPINRCITRARWHVHREPRQLAGHRPLYSVHWQEPSLIVTVGTLLSFAGNPKRCIPDFVNSAFGKLPEVIKLPLLVRLMVDYRAVLGC